MQEMLGRDVAKHAGQVERKGNWDSRRHVCWVGRGLTMLGVNRTLIIADR